MASNMKSEIKDDVGITAAGGSHQGQNPSPNPIELVSDKDEFKAAVQELDASRTALVKATIENLKPGRPFDSAVIREINKIETKKNRLIVSRFAALLKRNEPGIAPIVHQILEI